MTLTACNRTNLKYLVLPIYSLIYNSNNYFLIPADNVLKINIIGKTENCNEELIRIKLLSMMTHSRELLCKKHIDLIKSFIDKCDNESYRDYLIFNFA